MLVLVLVCALVFLPSLALASVTPHYVATFESDPFDWIRNERNGQVPSFQVGDRIRATVIFEASVLDAEGNGGFIHQGNHLSSSVLGWEINDGIVSYTVDGPSVIRSPQHSLSSSTALNGYGTSLTIANYEVVHANLSVSALFSQTNHYIRNTSVPESFYRRSTQYSQGTASGGTWSVTFVPEPTTALLLGIGLSALAARRKNR